MTSLALRCGEEGRVWDLKGGVRPSILSGLLDRHSAPSPPVAPFVQSSLPVFSLLSSLPDPWSSLRSLLCFSGQSCSRSLLAPPLSLLLV